MRPGDNELVVKVFDPTYDGPNPHGKQGVQYTATSGIWQTVWLETVPRNYVESLVMTPAVDQSQLILEVHVNGPDSDYTVQAVAKSGSTTVGSQTISGSTALHIEHPHLWSPDDPFLYDLQIRLVRRGKVVDQVKSYFGLRKMEIKKDASGIERIFLNNRYTYNLGVLDQGFWPDGIYTAPTDAALKFDIRAIKAMGFNTIRKHIKIEPERWYYHCDRLGVLVWQDMVSPSNNTQEARAQFEDEVKENLAQLHNHPSITTWVLFNEGWGAYDQERLARWIKHLDPSRLLDGNTGPFDTEKISESMRHMDPSKLFNVMNDIEALNELVVSMTDPRPESWVASDLTDFHHYPDPKMPPAAPGKAQVVGENGGIGVFIEGHVWNDIAGHGYVQVTPDRMPNAYAGIVDELRALESHGLSGSIYTQLYDVEEEQNGLMTYDRAVIKIPPAEIRRINARLIPPAKNLATAATGFSIANADTEPEAQRYAALLRRYKQGDRELPFLRHFTLMAIRQRDQEHATAAGNEFIERSTGPYSKDTWAFIK